MATFPEYADLFVSELAWEEGARHSFPRRATGRNILTVTISESYAERSLECAEQTCAGFAGQAGFEPEAVDLLVAHASVPGFADRLAARLGIPHERVASLSKSLGRAHTAAPALAIEPLYRNHKLSDGPVLFVSVGAGISVAAAIYHHR